MFFGRNGYTGLYPSNMGDQISHVGTVSKLTGNCFQLSGRFHCFTTGFYAFKLETTKVALELTAQTHFWSGHPAKGKSYAYRSEQSTKISKSELENPV